MLWKKFGEINNMYVWLRDGSRSFCRQEEDVIATLWANFSLEEGDWHLILNKINKTINK